MDHKKLDLFMSNDVRLLVWGSELKEDVFARWSQGFIFSESSPTALVQFEGGPCAVLVPVQAYLVKAALFAEGTPDISNLMAISDDKARSLLLDALLEILTHMTESGEFVLVSWNSPSPTLEANSVIGPTEDSAGETSNTAAESPQQRDVNITGQEVFHQNLMCSKVSGVEDLRKRLTDAMPAFQSQYGVLTFLYSVLLTKGIDLIKSEVEDASESLVDGMHGHGSQSLINLLITSQATSNVWDNDKEISGLKLRGVHNQSTVGFLTLLEHMRYCEVGWNLKNPKFPIWLLGSETHLTLLFSPSENLIVRDSPETRAKLIFSRFDPDGNGFIPTTALKDILTALDLVAENEYVDIMANKLDAESLGIITSYSFMEEFFPERPAELPRQFSLFHYNGLAQSCAHGNVTYVECKAVLEEEVDTQFITDTSPVKLCLQTKWPSIELTWVNNRSLPPSLN